MQEEAQQKETLERINAQNALKVLAEALTPYLRHSAAEEAVKLIEQTVRDDERLKEFIKDTVMDSLKLSVDLSYLGELDVDVDWTNY